MSYRTLERVLISLSASDLTLIEQALVAMGSGDAERCLSSLRADLQRSPMLTRRELIDAWADGSAVQVRVITDFGDPVDMAASEARELARRILAAADIAEVG